MVVLGCLCNVERCEHVKHLNMTACSYDIIQHQGFIQKAHTEIGFPRSLELQLECEVS